MTARPDLGHVMTRQHYERLAAELTIELATEPAAPHQLHARPAPVSLSGLELIALHAAGTDQPAT